MVEKRTKKDNKSVIVGGICIAMVIIAIIIVAAVVAINTNKLGDSYFVSDNNKYVLTMEYDGSEEEDNAYAPLKSHLVYAYSGDEITGVKAYYEFADEATAKKAYDFYSENNDGAYKSVALEGKYVILEANESVYEDMSASDVKTYID